MREVIATGRTVEDATESGCQELGLSRDAVSVEILEMPGKKLFKNIPAKVRITADEPAGAASSSAEKAQPAKAAAPAPQQTTAKPQPAAAPAAGQKPIKDKTTVLETEPEEKIDLETNPAAKMAAEYLTAIFLAAGAQEIIINAFKQGEATLLRVEGSGISDAIETRGETIQALSYLVDRAVNKGVDKKDSAYLRVRLDVAGYRSRRESELIALANRTAEEVLRTKRSRTLAPMNPYERLIIHTTISEIDGVISESTGIDTERRVVVKSTAPDATDGEDWRPPYNKGGRGSDRRSGGSHSGGNRGGRDRDRGPRGSGNRGSSGGGYGGNKGGYAGGRTSSTPEREYADKPHDPTKEPVVPQRREAIRDGEDMPLYGKIDV